MDRKYGDKFIVPGWKTYWGGRDWRDGRDERDRKDGRDGRDERDRKDGRDGRDERDRKDGRDGKCRMGIYRVKIELMAKEKQGRNGNPLSNIYLLNGGLYCRGSKGVWKICTDWRDRSV